MVDGTDEAVETSPVPSCPAYLVNLTSVVLEVRTDPEVLERLDRLGRAVTRGIGDGDHAGRLAIDADVDRGASLAVEALSWFGEPVEADVLAPKQPPIADHQPVATHNCRLPSCDTAARSASSSNAFSKSASVW